MLLTAPLTLLLVLAAPQPGFGWPLAGTPVVDRGFAPPATAYGAGHRGVDLRASPDAAVLSAGPGQVTYAGLLAGRGVVTVTHPGGLRTTYEPVVATVRVGQSVSRGTVLGHLGKGHASCRVGVRCLHWGLLRGSTYLDPLGLVVGRDVRLLPLTGLPALTRAQAQEPPAGRSTGALVATGGLATGLGLLVRRPGRRAGRR